MKTTAPPTFSIYRDGRQYEFTRMDDLVATPRTRGRRSAGGFSGFKIEKVQSTDAAQRTQRPVYRLGAEGPLSVATGALTLKLEPDATALPQTTLDQLLHWGFVIARQYPGMVIAEASDAESGLSHVTDISALPGVAEVEPMLVSVRAHKG